MSRKKIEKEGSWEPRRKVCGMFEGLEECCCRGVEKGQGHVGDLGFWTLMTVSDCMPNQALEVR